LEFCRPNLGHQDFDGSFAAKAGDGTQAMWKNSVGCSEGWNMATGCHMLFVVHFHIMCTWFWMVKSCYTGHHWALVMSIRLFWFQKSRHATIPSQGID
jgi:hypothetical protein